MTDACDLTNRGPTCPRQHRVLEAMLDGPLWREEVDALGGTPNGPQLIAALRRIGLSVPCERVPVKDRDGHSVHRGRYSLSLTDRAKVLPWFESERYG